MSLNQDQNWYMDTGATSHMAHTPGMLSAYVNNSSLTPIVVGNGSPIRTSGIGQTTLKPPYPPLKLPNILVSPSLIKNLLSVRRLTTDNDISIEFDRFGFLVKDFQTKLPIFRCNSSGDLYPLSLPSAASSSPSTFAALTQDRWHQRLGHPGASLLRLLHKQNSISVSSLNNDRLCQSCVFGKHIKLPFKDSVSNTLLPFDLIHSDLWTSPVTMGQMVNGPFGSLCAQTTLHSRQNFDVNLGFPRKKPPDDDQKTSSLLSILIFDKLLQSSDQLGFLHDFAPSSHCRSDELGFFMNPKTPMFL
ncbi:hypothetical protein OSB04_016122 [Centaurea solstitialis]|uniref:GAG-pre-integrase domain-containing protein n=1 Tax=Centaurea solstitialis TaxID=347529 RepID=A0AA38W9I6_9ASTR|nr:hypothetical protein OSB04_016122 [Centaurea solstitialis]